MNNRLSYEQQYLALCQDILENGVWVENERTGKKCLTKINHDFVYDASQPPPLLTTKQHFVTSAIAEVIGYWRQYTDAQEFADIGSPSWFSNAASTSWQNNPNCQGKTHLGDTYRFGEQGYFVEVEPAIFPVKEVKKTVTKTKKINYPTLPCNEDYIGKVFESCSSGKYEVVDYIGKSGDKRINYFQIRFLDTGTSLTIQKSQIRNGNIKDYNKASVYGIGVLGGDIPKEDRWLYKTWVHMLERCYVEHSVYYNLYGGNGVFVHDDWLNFKNFRQDVSKLENFYLAKEFPKEFTLDKDFFKSNMYSKNTCKWASKKEQALNTRNVKTYQVGDKYIKGVEFLRKELKMSRATVEKKLRLGEIDLAPDSVNISYCEVNPFKEIYCKLKNGVDDRRLIATAWLPHLQQKACLMPCAYEHIWSLLDGKLSLTVTQRSGDLPLGVPWNSVSFYFLLKLMAKITGTVPDKVYHKIVNVHIYEDQIEPLKKQLSRKPLDITPSLEINDWVHDLQDVIGNNLHAREFFTLTGYEHLGRIDFPFSE